jgi:endogenous inhibitor of DNA gyrase (YacG/DUF329 family)
MMKYLVIDCSKRCQSVDQVNQTHQHQYAVQTNHLTDSKYDLMWQLYF